jgi:hypothetical protein
VAASVFAVSSSHVGRHDPCDSYGDCVSSSITFLRSNPDNSLYLGDGFKVSASISAGQNSTNYSVAWTFPSVFDKSGDTFVVVENRTGTFSVQLSVTFTGSVMAGNATQSFASVLTTIQSVTVIPLVISLQTQLLNLTDSHGQIERNPDGSFYYNDTFCDSWTAAFQFATQRPDVKINVSSLTPASLRVLNYSADPLGREGRFCYAVRTGSAYGSYNATLVARAFNWQGVSLAQKESSQPFAVVQYDPQFTSYAYMEYGNSTSPSSLERPWVLFVRYDGNDPGYSYAGDSNTAPFNGSRTLAERAYFDGFRFATLSYQPFTTGDGIFEFHMANNTGAVQYEWLDSHDSVPLAKGNPIEKYVFEATPPSLSPVLASGYTYQNVTMIGCWQQQRACDLRQNYWLVPFLWSGRVSIVSVDSNGNLLQNTPISLTIHNSSPLDDLLTASFDRVFGSDQRALKAFERDLYPTNQTMTFSGSGSLSILLNQTSLAPPEMSITAGGATTVGTFTFTPVLLNGPIGSVPNINGTVFYANATIPIWSYNMVQRSLVFMPVTTTISQPTAFLELVNSSGWVAGDTTEPQTPSAFASQDYGFWPMGENLTVYVNLQGGGVNLLAVEQSSPGAYQGSFFVEPWSGGISSVQLVEDGHVIENESLLNPSAYQSPLPQGLAGLYTMTLPVTGQDVEAVFTNVWGAKTTIDLGTLTAQSPVISLIPTSTAAAFGIAFIAWFIVNSFLKTRKVRLHG